MSKSELVTAFEHNHGILKTAQLNKLNIDSRDINNLIKKGVIEKISVGYYRYLLSDFNEAAIISRLFPDGILWMDTALFYYGYIDRTPSSWDIIISKNASRTRASINEPQVNLFYVEPKRISYGITQIEIDGCSLNILDRDRLICELLKYESTIEKETFNKAILAYISDSKKNIKNLMVYAQHRKVTQRVKDVIGIWL